MNARCFRVFLTALLLLPTIALESHTLSVLRDNTTLGIRSFHKVPMTHGTLLATDVYLPEGKGPWPVILMRSPYGRNFGMNGSIQDGYAVAVQDLRGFGASQGDRNIFYSDGWRPGLTDGTDTVSWILRQPWCNGKIGTTGTSALAMTQILMAPATTGLSAQFMVRVPSNFYLDCSYVGGVYKKMTVKATSWRTVSLACWNSTRMFQVMMSTGPTTIRSNAQATSQRLRFSRMDGMIFSPKAH